MKVLGVLLVALTVRCFGADSPAFEVATIRPAAELESGMGHRITRYNGGPGTQDPGRISYVNVSFRELLMLGWNLRERQIVGPSWMDSKSFNVEAKLPPGTKKEDLAPMLRRLVTERFALRSHEEKRVVRGYTLTVIKGGQRLAIGGKSDLNTANNHDGFPTGSIPTGHFQSIHFPGHARLAGLNVSIDQFATALAGELQTQVVNETNLPGTYDIDLVFSADAVSARPDDNTAADEGAPELGSGLGIFAAIQKQLGLKLQGGRHDQTVLVVESAEQTPRVD